LCITPVITIMHNVESKVQVAMEAVRMLAPCIERKLDGMGVAGSDVTKVVDAATQTASKKYQATKLYRALLLLLLRGEVSEATAMGVIVALELRDGNYQLITTKEQVAMETVRMMAPCIERKLDEKGVSDDDVSASSVSAAERGHRGPQARQIDGGGGRRMRFDCRCALTVDAL
jgi:3-oxoacyl-[acyl-carrier-protein] synthase III